MRWVPGSCGNPGSSVEIAEGPDVVWVRWWDADGPALEFDRHEWGEFVAGLRAAGAEGAMRARLLSALAVAAAYVATAPLPLVF